MNSTNTSDTGSVDSWGDYYTKSSQLDEVDFYIVTAISVLQLLILGLLIWSEKKTTTKVFTSVNVLILLMIISNCFVSGFKYYTWGSTADMLQLIVYSTLMNFSFSVHLFVLVCYTWTRGKPVVQQFFPFLYPILRGFVVLFGLILLTVFIAAALANASFVDSSLEPYWETCVQINTYLTFTIDAFIFAFDLVVVVFYLRYLASVLKDPAIHDVQRLKVISRYGIVSCMWLELWLSSYVVFNYFNSQLIPSIGLSFYLALSGFFNLGILVYIFIQLAMKWSLLKEKESRLSITRASITRALIADSRDDRLSTGKHIRVSTISKIYDTGTNASGRESESRSVI